MAKPANTVAPSITAPTHEVEGLVTTGTYPNYTRQLGKFFEEALFLGATLTANHGTWTESPTEYKYKWYYEELGWPFGEGKVAVASGGTSETMELTEARVPSGSRVFVGVIGKNAEGEGTEKVSAGRTAVIYPGYPFNLTPPSLFGVAMPGQTLEVKPGSWAAVKAGVASGANALVNTPAKIVSRTFFLQKIGESEKKTYGELKGNTYKVTEEDVGKQLLVFERVYTALFPTSGLSVAQSVQAITVVAAGSKLTNEEALIISGNRHESPSGSAPPPGAEAPGNSSGVPGLETR